MNEDEESFHYKRDAIIVAVTLFFVLVTVAATGNIDGAKTSISAPSNVNAAENVISDPDTAK